MGLEGLAALARFVEQGGLLITEGSTATIFPEYGLTRNVTVEQAPSLFVRGSILRTRIADAASPIVYGYTRNALPAYFNQAPLLAVADPRHLPAGLQHHHELERPRRRPLTVEAACHCSNPSAPPADRGRRPRYRRRHGLRRPSRRAGCRRRFPFSSPRSTADD